MSDNSLPDSDLKRTRERAMKLLGRKEQAKLKYCSNCGASIPRKEKNKCIECGYESQITHLTTRCEKAEANLETASQRLMSANCAVDLEQSRVKEFEGELYTAKQSAQTAWEKEQVAQAKVKELLGYTHATCPGCGRDFVVLEVHESELVAQNKALREGLEEIKGTGTSMPPGFGDEVSWYRGLAWGFISVANKALTNTDKGES